MTNYWILLLWLTIHSSLLCGLLLAHCQYLHRFNIVIGLVHSTRVRLCRDCVVTIVTVLFALIVCFTRFLSRVGMKKEFSQCRTFLLLLLDVGLFIVVIRIRFDQSWAEWKLRLTSSCHWLLNAVLTIRKKRKKYIIKRENSFNRLLSKKILINPQRVLLNIDLDDLVIYWN